MNSVTIESFAASFGATTEELPARCRELIMETDFRYEVLADAAREKVILEVLKRADADDQHIGDPERRKIWEKGWGENLDRYMKSGGDMESLVPKFIRSGQVVRYGGQYIQPKSPTFELNYSTVFRTWLFDKYLRDCTHIYEFGCGTGLNLVLLASLFPEKDLHGCDFVESAVKLVNQIGSNSGTRITGHLFDMTNPDVTFKLEGASGVFTYGALEQLAGRFESFLEFLLKMRPRICISVEPTVELYDENNLFDYLAVRFHRKRGYTAGLLPRLRELDRQGRLKLLKIQRLNFGSLMMEGYSYYVWRAL